MPIENLGSIEGKNPKINELARQLHEMWRRPRYRPDSNDFKPRIKITDDEKWLRSHDGADEVDIANTSYEDLPEEWQRENRISAEIAVTLVEEALSTATTLDTGFVEWASSIIHNKWLERNGEWASPEQNLPYADLPEEEKEKDRSIIKEAIDIFRAEQNK